MNDPASMANLEDTQNLYVHCAGGYRSVIASSLLKRQGFHNLRNIAGGWAKIKEQEKVEIVKEKSLLNYALTWRCWSPREVNNRSLSESAKP